MRYIFSICLVLLTGLALSAQNLDEELGFIYVKADYLLETERYPEAIEEFSKIIESDPTFKDALYKRATAKYEIGAFKGVKLDLLRAFEHTGISPEAIELYGIALDALGENASASKTQKTASMLVNASGNTKPTSQSGQSGNPRGSKKDDHDEIKDEVKKLEDKITTILEDLLPDENQPETSGDPTSTEQGETDSSSNDIEEEEPVDVYIPDNSVNEIYIDEDLTLEIKNGLGNRRVLQQPNILILSESSGIVAVDVCVNRNGKVTSAEHNAGKSDLSIQSLISLAVRKSKEFWFEKSDRSETCGTIVFKISGRN